MISRFCLCVILAFPALPAAAQNKFATVEGDAAPHMPTLTECLDALNTGAVLPPAPDGRIRVIKGSTLYTVDLLPTSIACEGVRYSE